MTISNKNRNIVFGIVCPTVSPVNLIVCQTCIHQMEEINVRTTYIAKPGEVERKWYVVDATDVPLGRLSAVVASVLRGKNKPTFTPNVDTGDYVVVVNAEKVALTGRKDKNKIYYHHSNHPGGLKARTAGDYREKDPKSLSHCPLRACFQRVPLAVNKLRSFMYTVAQITSMQHKTQKFWISLT